jgi:hypothetical protein
MRICWPRPKGVELLFLLYTALSTGLTRLNKGTIERYFCWLKSGPLSLDRQDAWDLGLPNWYLGRNCTWVYFNHYKTFFYGSGSLPALQDGQETFEKVDSILLWGTRSFNDNVNDLQYIFCLFLATSTFFGKKICELISYAVVYCTSLLRKEHCWS